MEVIAKARFVRMSPRKVRLVAGLVRGLDIDKAEDQLNFSVKAAARPVLKLLQSATANAEHNHKLERENLFIKVITVDGGPMLKRWRARAFGRAAPIRKRTCHINIILSEKKGPADKKAGLKAALVKPEDKDKKTEKKEEKKPVDRKVDAKDVKKSVSKKRVVSKKTEKVAPKKKTSADKPDIESTKKPVSPTTKREHKK